MAIVTKEKASTSELVVQEALGGLSAGLVGTLIGFPLDLVKTRMQTFSSATANNGINAGGGGGVVSTGYYIARNEGILALYKGIGPPLISLSILNTVTFASYSYFRKLYDARFQWDVRNALAGSTCGIFAGVVSTVENRIKTEMQLDNVTNKRYRGSFHCAMTLIQQDRGSIVTLYKGHVINMMREMVFLGTYFFVYEGLRHVLVGSIGTTSATTNNTTANATFCNNNYQNDGSYHIIDKKFAVPIAGGLAGATAWFISFPLDCIRAHVQQGPYYSAKSTSSIQVFKELLQSKGIRGLYAGVTPSILRAFLVSGSRFSAYELALWFLRGGRDNNATE